MTTSRRDFLKHAAFLASVGASAGAHGGLPDSIRRALAVEPAPGSTFLDAEHIVILMQENRSFDHTFGSLRGVRGFNDPRAIPLADGSPVWAQPDTKGDRYLPFRMDIKATKATWMGSLPHSWTNQVDARNDGLYDRWLAVKQHGDDEYRSMPLTLGYYTREDIPFYYALADAFTVCDHNFCSSLTGTTPNRLHLWTGTVRAQQRPDAFAHIMNSDVVYERWASWKTFPERLQDAGVSWKTYQNEISLESGLRGEHDAWLANFEDNPLEWFAQYGVRYAANHQTFIRRRIDEIPGELLAKKASAATATGEPARKLAGEIRSLEAKLARYKSEIVEFSAERFAALPEPARDLHHRAFTINQGDPDYRELETLTYRDGEIDRKTQAPKGDPLHQFRKDVADGKLPTVSWLVPSERFSDHPSSAWYGAWYLSEVLDILTANPEVWRKTIFILTYDENDGYFDHVPPFVPPHPAKQDSGRVSEGIDPALEYVTLEHDKKWHPDEARESAIGLGYRVPMVVASPWSRGGAVCSQVFDHTSVIQLLEKILSHKTGKPIRETNITAWRRAVCGDMTSVFRAADDSPTKLRFLERDEFLADIHRAQFKDVPKTYRKLAQSEVDTLRTAAPASGLLPRQEPGVKPACPLPYELLVSGTLDESKSALTITFEARRDLFKDRAAGAPFVVYADTAPGKLICRNYAVEPGRAIADHFPLSMFEGGIYRLRVYGPAGFYWELRGSASDPSLRVTLTPMRSLAAQDSVEILAEAAQDPGLIVRDLAYGAREQQAAFSNARALAQVPTRASAGWYDIRATTADPHFARRFAGHVECGTWTTTDPLMGGVLEPSPS